MFWYLWCHRFIFNCLCSVLLENLLHSLSKRLENKNCKIFLFFFFFFFINIKNLNNNSWMLRLPAEYILSLLSFSFHVRRPANKSRQKFENLISVELKMLDTIFGCRISQTIMLTDPQDFRIVKTFKRYVSQFCNIWAISLQNRAVSMTIFWSIARFGRLSSWDNSETSTVHFSAFLFSCLNSLLFVSFCGPV